MNPTTQRATVQPGNRLTFMCPGCKMHHSVVTAMPNPWNAPAWAWNGSTEQPTLTPSVLVQWDTLSEASRARNAQFYKDHGRYMTSEELPYDVHNVCHSFVGCNGAQPGQIIFLSDCTHALAGQVHDLPEVDSDE